MHWELSNKGRVTKESSIESAGIADSLTGRHYDLIVTDDIVTLRDRLSKAERETVKSYYRELHNIKTAETGRIASSGTPWARDDAFTIMPAALKYPYDKTKLIPASTIKELRDRMPYSLFSANYRLEHVADESKILENPQFAPWYPRNASVMAYLDPAFGGENNTSIAIGYKYGKDAYLRGYTWRERNVIDAYREIASQCKLWNVGTLFVEANKDEGACAREMRKYHPAVVEARVFKNKHIRILRLKENWKQIFFADDCNEEFLNNLVDYAEGEHPDDEADAAAGLVEKLNLTDAGNRFVLGQPSVVS